MAVFLLTVNFLKATMIRVVISFPAKITNSKVSVNPSQFTLALYYVLSFLRSSKLIFW